MTSLHLKLKAYEELIAEAEANVLQLKRTQDGLQQRIDTEQRLLNLLMEKRKAIAEGAEQEQSRSIADHIVAALYENGGGPMRSMEIVEYLAARGIGGDSPNGPTNSILSALNRPNDRIRKLDRGLYTLAEAALRPDRFLRIPAQPK